MQFWNVKHINCEIFLCPNTHTHIWFFSLQYVWNWQLFKEKHFMCVCVFEWWSFLFCQSTNNWDFDALALLMFAPVTYPICPFFCCHSMLNGSFKNANNTKSMNAFMKRCVQMKSLTIKNRTCTILKRQTIKQKGSGITIYYVCILKDGKLYITYNILKWKNEENETKRMSLFFYCF